MLDTIQAIGVADVGSAQSGTHTAPWAMYEDAVLLFNRRIARSNDMSNGWRRYSRTAAAGLIAIAAACTERERTSPDTARAPVAITAAEVSLIDSAYPPAVAGREGWDFQQSATRDLNGDGAAERVVLTARAEMRRGRPLWDDGQPWQVYVETANGQRTYMYSRYVQLGTLAMRITEPASGTSPRIVILEQLPDRLAVYEGEYRGVGQLRVTAAYERLLDPRGDMASPTLP